MNKLCLIRLFLCVTLASFWGSPSRAATGDTIHVQAFNQFLHQNCNSGRSVFLFPPDSLSFYKILLRYQLSCPSFGCDIYDRIATLKVYRHTGVIDSTLTLAPSFRVDNQIRDSLYFMNDTSYSYSWNQSSMSVDSSALPSLQVVFYNDSLQPLIPTDTVTVWPAYFNQYVFDSSGTALDSVAVPPDDSLFVTVDTVYVPFEVMDPVEIARAITPFGEGVTLWFDVSDYRTLLHDSVDLYSRVCGYSNGWLVSTDFYFIEGRPPLHPYKLTNLWNGTFAYGSTTDPIENHLQPDTLELDSQTVYTKIRLVTTGHGFGGNPNPEVAEFYDVTHKLVINGDTLPQHLWRSDCGSNPLYPQGAPGYTSTWFYKRANWCPGSYVTPHDYNATGLAPPGGQLIVDYNMEPYTVTGGPAGFYAPEYYIQSQAVFYDSIAYTNNAAIIAIRRPSDAFEQNRRNPVCEGVSPEITIKNYGYGSLTNLTIHYGVDGNINQVFTWTGVLNFLDTVTLELPTVSFGAGNHEFSVYSELPNGFQDEFPFDDTLRSPFHAVNVYNTNFIRMVVKTDGSPSEVSWDIKDAAGTVFASRNNFPASNSLYIDTVFLSTGCYSFTIYDSFGDGLCCYGGNGFFRILKGATATVIGTSGDYGDFYSVQATIDNGTGTIENQIQDFIRVYPNPAGNSVTVNTSVAEGPASITLYDFSGRILKSWDLKDLTNYRFTLDVSPYTEGMYFLELKSGGERAVARLVIQR